MKVILLQNVKNTGRKYDVVNVKKGYGLNFLIPNKLARHASKGALRDIELRKTKQSETEALDQENLHKVLKDLEGKTITLKERANEKGHLFAKVGVNEIQKGVLEQLGVFLPEEVINMDSDIKEVGEHEVNLVSGEIKAKLNLKIEAE